VKLATFEISTPAGPLRRIGAAVDGKLVDFAAAYAAHLDCTDPGSDAQRVAGMFFPADMVAFLGTGDLGRRAAEDAINTAAKTDEAFAARTKYATDEVRLLAPVTRPRVIRDFLTFEGHMLTAGKALGRPQIPPVWYEVPAYYKGDPDTVSGPDEVVEWPKYCEKLDFELEIGLVVGQPSPMGEMLTEKQAEEMIFGFVILNDWSARDIQQWEYVPLGPFQAKAFATSISPWIVTREALEPFRVPGPAQEPVPLPYLRQEQPNNYDLQLDVALRAAQMNEGLRICRTNFKYMYWSSVQQLVHHASSGCAMNIGDLLGSGTISGPEKDQRGSDTVTEKVARLKLTIGLDLGNSSRFGAESEVSL